jgi:hypothetical protein
MDLYISLLYFLICNFGPYKKCITCGALAPVGSTTVAIRIVPATLHNTHFDQFLAALDSSFPLLAHTFISYSKDFLINMLFLL